MGTRTLNELAQMLSRFKSKFTKHLINYAQPTF